MPNFISGKNVLVEWRIEKYILMDLIHKGLQPWHPASLKIIHRDIIPNLPSDLQGKVKWKPREGVTSTQQHKTLPYEVYNIEEIYPFLEECLFSKEDIGKLIPVNNPLKKKRSSSIHRDAVRDSAKTKWEKDESLTIRDVIDSDDINAATSPVIYNEKTLRDWVKDLAPNRKPGRRPKKQ
jgi:hypothetical protein